jgi:hypothetical protein
LLLAALLLSLVAGAWLGANLLLQSAPPSALWTEADLPSPPAGADNGWTHFDRQARTRGHLSLTYALAEVCTPSSRPGPDRWREARILDGAIHEFLQDTSHAAWVQLLGDAMAKPVFADACPIAIDADCQHLKLLQAHRAYELSVIDAALDGRWNEVVQRSTLLARGDVRLASSPRSVLSQLISLAMVQRMLVMVEITLAGRREAESRGERIEADLAPMRALHDALGALRMEDMDLRRCVIADYLFALEVLEVMEGGTGAFAYQDLDWGPFGSAFFDKGATMQSLNNEFQPLAAFAQSPATAPAPVFATHTKSRLWWLRNPVGKLLLDGTRVDIADRIRKADLDRKEILKRRDALLALIAPMLAGE